MAFLELGVRDWRIVLAGVEEGDGIVMKGVVSRCRPDEGVVAGSIVGEATVVKVTFAWGNKLDGGGMG